MSKTMTRSVSDMNRTVEVTDKDLLSIDGMTIEEYYDKVGLVAPTSSQLITDGKDVPYAATDAMPDVDVLVLHELDTNG